jgi:hypothetical protein
MFSSPFIFSSASIIIFHSGNLHLKKHHAPKNKLNKVVCPFNGPNHVKKEVFRERLTLLYPPLTPGVDSISPAFISINRNSAIGF